MIRRKNISPTSRDSFTASLIYTSSIASKKFFIAPVKCQLIVAKEVHTTAGDDSGTVTGTLERLQGTETLGNGDELCTAGFNLKGTAETVQTATLVQTSAVTLAAGDRLAFKLTGTSTTLANMVVTCQLRPVD